MWVPYICINNNNPGGDGHAAGTVAKRTDNNPNARQTNVTSKTNNNDTAAKTTDNAALPADVAGKLLAGLQSSKREGKALTGAALKVAQALREAGDNGAGLTTVEVQDLTGKDDRQTRKLIRMAQAACAAAGDMCLTSKNGGGAGNVNEYRVVRKTIADQLPADVVEAAAAAADSFAYGDKRTGRFAKKDR